MKTKVIQNLIIFILLAQIANVDCDLKAKATRKKKYYEYSKTNSRMGWSTRISSRRKRSNVKFSKRILLSGSSW